MDIDPHEHILDPMDDIEPTNDLPPNHHASVFYPTEDFTMFPFDMNVLDTALSDTTLSDARLSDTTLSDTTLSDNILPDNTLPDMTLADTTTLGESPLQFSFDNILFERTLPDMTPANTPVLFPSDTTLPDMTVSEMPLPRRLLADTTLQLPFHTTLPGMTFPEMALPEMALADTTLQSPFDTPVQSTFDTTTASSHTFQTAPDVSTAALNPVEPSSVKSNASRNGSESILEDRRELPRRLARQSSRIAGQRRRQSRRHGIPRNVVTKPLQRAKATQAETQSFSVGDLQGLTCFFIIRFKELTVSVVKRIITEWIWLAEPERTRLYGPYHKSKPMKMPADAQPPWWPQDATYDESSRLLTDGMYLPSSSRADGEANILTEVWSVGVAILRLHEHPDAKGQPRVNWTKKLKKSAIDCLKRLNLSSFSQAWDVKRKEAMKERVIKEVLPDLFAAAQAYEDHVAMYGLHKGGVDNNLEAQRGKLHTWQAIPETPRKVRPQEVLDAEAIEKWEDLNMPVEKIERYICGRESSSTTSIANETRPSIDISPNMQLTPTNTPSNECVVDTTSDWIDVVFYLGSSEVCHHNTSQSLLCGEWTPVDHPTQAADTNTGS